MIISRPFWLDRIEKAWSQTTIVWLAGVRRSGKTTLIQILGSDRVHYINCDLPTVEDMVSNPELFYRNCDRPIVAFDEIHQLMDPSRLLKIGADAFAGSFGGDQDDIHVIRRDNSGLLLVHDRKSV